MTASEREQALRRLLRSGCGLPAARDLATEMLRQAERRRLPRVSHPMPRHQRDESSRLGQMLACLAIAILLAMGLLA